MFSIKFFPVLVLIAMFSFMVSGCETLPPGEPGEDEATKEGRLPEWLQLAYRKTEGYRFDYEDNDFDLDEITEEDLVDPEAAEEPAETEEEPVEKPAETAEEAEEAPATAEATDPGDDEVTDEKPKPGSMDYIIWKREQAKDQEKQGVFDESDRWWEVDADPAGFDHHVIQHGDEETDEE